MSHLARFFPPGIVPARWPPLGPVLLLLALAIPPPPAEASDATGPKKLGLKETVRMDLVQLEVTVWPKAPDSDACLGLTADDFELLLDREPQPIYAVDSLGSDQATYMAEAPPSGESPGGGLSVVLFFDLWHLDLAYRGYPACPITKPLAFSEAQRFVREEFHEGDRLLLVTAAGWPVVHYGWIRTRAEALQALDRLAKNHEVLMPRQEHANHLGWIAGIESLFLALGRYPGRKDVIYLADDFRFDDVAMRMYELAARAQANGVVVNAVDLLESCRKVPGRPCVLGGGLGCTEFNVPVALNSLSGDTGGALFQTDRIGAAVHQLRAMRKCRYLVSFRKEARKRKRPPVIALNLRENRRDLTLLAPASFQAPGKAPSQKEKDEALFLLPRFGRGIAAQVTLWPYRPAKKHGRWKAFILARVDRTDDEPWPDELTEITVSALLHRQSEVFGEYRKKIEGEDLTAFRTRGGTRLMLFPLEEIRAGDVTVDLTVTSNVEEISANLRKSFDVPDPPGAGEARPWFLSDRVVRFGASDVLAPSLDDDVTEGEPLSFMGYGCHSKGAAPVSYSGQVVPFAGGPPVPVPLMWLEGTRPSRDGCGWLVGQPAAPLPPGLWTFEPPANLALREGAAGVEFHVEGGSAPTTIPEEVRPR